MKNFMQLKGPNRKLLTRPFSLNPLLSLRSHFTVFWKLKMPLSQNAQNGLVQFSRSPLQLFSIRDNTSNFEAIVVLWKLGRRVLALFKRIVSRKRSLSNTTENVFYGKKTRKIVKENPSLPENRNVVKGIQLQWYVSHMCNYCICW